MNKLHLLPSGLFFVASTLLVACGGGGGSSGAPASSSSAAVSAIASSVVNLPSSSAASSVPATTQLTIKGTAVADELKGGEVSVVVGAQSFKTAINGEGLYQLTVDVANTDIDQPFTAIATGAASNNWVQLAALYPSISKLVTLAGTDKVLDATEYLGVNISPMTTAEYALVFGRKLPMETAAEHKYALLQINAEDELSRAVFVKNVLSNKGVGLPKKYKTTLEMLLDDQYTSGQINILRAESYPFKDEFIKLQSDPLQTYISDQQITGKFIVTNGAYLYLLDINADGTGNLLASRYFGGQIWSEDRKFREAAFTWARTLNDVKITFNSPIDYGRSAEYSDVYEQECISQSETPYLPECTIKVDSMLVSLISENEVGKTAEITLNTSLKNSSGTYALDIVIDNGRAKLFDKKQFYKFSKEELYGYDWYTPLSSYSFKANGSATKVNQLNKTEFSFNWVLEDGVVILDDEGSFLIPMYPFGPGFVAIEFVQQGVNSEAVSVFEKNMLLKQENVSMTESDWVGRWNRVADYSFYSAVDYYSNHLYRDGFETQALGSWSVVSNSHVRGYANGEWRMEHELLAIHDGQHYMQYCYGFEYYDGNFTPLNCLLEAYSIDKTFAGTTFWATWSNPLFQESGSLYAWRFAGNRLERDGMPTFNYERVAANMYYEREYDKVLELLSSTQDSIEVCEYDAFSSCDSGTVYNLRRGIEVKVNVIGSGLVDSFSYNRSFMIKRGQSYLLPLAPASGYQITVNNISGCEGALVNKQYTISARDSDCELTVNFTPIPQ